MVALTMQLIGAEDARVGMSALWAPSGLIALPPLTVMAAAVLFETIGFLRGGIGNVVYFFARVAGLAPAPPRFSMLTMLRAQLRWLLRGQPWWWYASATGLIVAGCVMPPTPALHGLLNQIFALNVTLLSLSRQGDQAPSSRPLDTHSHVHEEVGATCRRPAGALCGTGLRPARRKAEELRYIEELIKSGQFRH